MLLLTSLAALGIRRHIEIAWQSGYTWIQECRELISNFPCLRLRALAAGSPGVPLGFHWGSPGFGIFADGLGPADVLPERAARSKQRSGRGLRAQIQKKL